jgi:cell division protein FtsB
MDPSPSDADPDDPSGLSRLGAWLRPALVVGLLTFAAGVVFGNVLPTRAEAAATQRRLDDTRAENERLRRRIAALADDARRLEKDPWTTERLLRDEFRMSAEDEVLIR